MNEKTRLRIYESFYNRTSTVIKEVEKALSWEAPDDLSRTAVQDIADQFQRAIDDLVMQREPASAWWYPVLSEENLVDLSGDLSRPYVWKGPLTILYALFKKGFIGNLHEFVDQCYHGHGAKRRPMNYQSVKAKLPYPWTDVHPGGWDMPRLYEKLRAANNTRFNDYSERI